MDPENLINFSKSILDSMQKGIVKSCHDLSEGGLAIAIAEMAFGSEYGAEIELAALEDMRADEFIFSESNTRWAVEVKGDAEFESLLNKNKVPFMKVGKVSGKKLLIKQKGVKIIDAPVDTLRDKWKNAIWEHMG